MSDFNAFARLVEKNHKAMTGDRFKVDIDIWDTYLDAYPAEENPIFRTNRVYDCNCCRQFIKNIGTSVTINGNDEIVTVWDGCESLPYPFNLVAAKLSEEVRNGSIIGLFKTSESKYGQASTRSMKDGELEIYNHFEGSVRPSSSPGSEIGRYNAAVNVFKRGLEEINEDDLVDVIQMIKSDSQSIYRGQEFLKDMEGFLDLMTQYKSSTNKELFIWRKAADRFSKFRNTVIGTLFVDMSEGKTLEDAVKSFESKVAPHNYKRPKALISKRMVESAMAKIDELDLRSSLERRHATISDISVQDVLFADRSYSPLMKDPLSDLLMSETKKSKPVKSTDKIRKISMDDFLEEILPSTSTLEIQVTPQHKPHFVSITAPVYAGEPRLFSWSNDFSWSYDGNTSDSSIKERVKKAGGNVSAPFRVSLGWHNADDLDLHCKYGNEHIYFGNKKGVLDVDMNALGVNNDKDPVENMCWMHPKDGIYEIVVHNFTKRASHSQGFELEVENNGESKMFFLDKSPEQKGQVHSLSIKMRKGEIQEILSHNGLKEGSQHKEHWGVSLGEFTKVKTVMLSPNHWGDNEVGNKHLFFILENCLNPEPTRGMYNENLRSELHDHRKVFEVLGSKMMCAPTEEQLSGVGFSSTIKATILVKTEQGMFNLEV